MLHRQMPAAALFPPPSIPLSLSFIQWEIVKPMFNLNHRLCLKIISQHTHTENVYIYIHSLSPPVLVKASPILGSLIRINIQGAQCERKEQKRKGKDNKRGLNRNTTTGGSRCQKTRKKDGENETEFFYVLNCIIHPCRLLFYIGLS